MENKINIAELLKDCPSGMELDCTIVDGLYFDKVTENNEIKCYSKRFYESTSTCNSICFYSDGSYLNHTNAKCVIFPKGKTTWEGFQRHFKDGDIVATTTGSWIGITEGGKIDTFIPTYCVIKSNDEFEAYLDRKDKWHFSRLATEKEKEKLFNAIKANGYHWNEETKTLEKLSEPHTSEKFYIRIGDIPSEEKSAVYKGDVVIGYEDGVSVYDCVETDGLYRIVMPFPLKEGQGMTYECLIQEITQCRYEIENPRNVYLVSGIEVGKGHDNEPLIKEVKILKDLTGQFNTKNNNAEKTKTIEKLPRFKVGNRVKSKINQYEYTIIDIRKDVYIMNYANDKFAYHVPFCNEDNFSLVPSKFDINTLKPFESKVLVRDCTYGMWKPVFWGKDLECSTYRYLTSNGCYKQCIPYKGNEHLLGNNNDCDEFYKTW